MGERRVVFCVFVGKPEGKKPLGRPTLILCEDNIEMDLQEEECGTWTSSIWLRIGTGGGQWYMR
jgi:hypothetical protein